MKNATKGFTLIEVMVVIAIIGILGAIIIPASQVYICESNGYTWENGKCYDYTGDKK